MISKEQRMPLLKATAPLLEEMNKRRNFKADGSKRYHSDSSTVHLVEFGKKYLKVVEYTQYPDGKLLNGSVCAFIDVDGNIYASASASSPAKHVRGNLNENSGFDALTENGNIRYLR